MSVQTPDIERMASILADATVQYARDEGVSIPVAYVWVRRAFAARWPALASIVPATFSQVVGHDTAVKMTAVCAALQKVGRS